MRQIINNLLIDERKVIEKISLFYRLSFLEQSLKKTNNSFLWSFV